MKEVMQMGMDFCIQKALKVLFRFWFLEWFWLLVSVNGKNMY